MKRLLFYFFICLTTQHTLFAQYAAPVKEVMRSEILDEQRDLEIILPDNYASDTTHYDVWYVLDGFVLQ